jgi:hypothetical protein
MLTFFRNPFMKPTKDMPVEVPGTPREPETTPKIPEQPMVPREPQQIPPREPGPARPEEVPGKLYATCSNAIFGQNPVSTTFFELKWVSVVGW